MKKEERIIKMRKLLDYDVFAVEEKPDNYNKILYGNIEIKHRFLNIINKTTGILMDLGRPGFNIDLEEYILADKLIRKIENLEFKEEREYEYLFENSYISLLRSYRFYIFNIQKEILKQSEFYKNLNKKQKIEFEETIDKLKQKIIVPKGYDIDDLVKFYLELAIQKKGVPATRDLAKCSEYNKDKWNKKILKDYDFVMKLNTELHLLSKKAKFKDMRWFIDISEYWKGELTSAQKRDKISSLKSHAKEFKDNIKKEDNDY